MLFFYKISTLACACVNLKYIDYIYIYIVVIIFMRTFDSFVGSNHYKVVLKIGALKIYSMSL